MDHNEVMQWWKEHAPTYFTDKVYEFSQSHLIDSLKILKSDRVLEIGFGYGRELSQFCKLSDHVYGVELYQVTCDLVKDIPAEVQTYDGVNLPFQNECFDIIYSCFVLQHMSRLAAIDLINEAIRCLSPCGRILMEFYGDPLYQHSTEDRYSGDPMNGGMYNNGYTLESVQDVLKCTGLQYQVEKQKVSVDERNFYNYWGFLSK